MIFAQMELFGFSTGKLGDVKRGRLFTLLALHHRYPIGDTCSDLTSYLLRTCQQDSNTGAGAVNIEIVVITLKFTRRGGCDDSPSRGA